MKAYGLLAALFCISASHAGAASPVLVTHFEPLVSLSLESASQGVPQKVQPSAPLTLKFDTLGERYELDLEPNDRLLSLASRQELPGDIALYRGRALGKPGSWTRIVIANGIPRGLIWDGGQMIVIEAPGDSAATSATPIAYRLADAFVAPGTMTCGASTPGGSGAAMYTKLVAELRAAQAAAPGATMELRLSAIGDFEFADRIGTDVDTAIVTRLNNVDGIFSEQLGIQLTVDTVEVHSDADDPFTDTADSGDLLDELGIYRRDTPPHTAHGLTHMYTGRDLLESTVGIAYLDALCSPRFGAGLTEGRHGASFDSLITAHEIGHNFGAPHDAEEGSPCVAESEDFIMAPSVNGSTQFSQCSIAQMEPVIAAAQCITELPRVDMTVSAGDSAAAVAPGDDVSLAFEASNVGTLPASNVSIELQANERVTFVSVTSPAGQCTIGGGSANCELDTVPAGSNRAVTVTVAGVDPGLAPVRATVFADDDENTGNDSATIDLEVVEAVNLGINTFSLTQVTLNQSVPIRIGMDNRSILNATGIEVGISLSGGLRANTASWSLGSCAVSPQQIDCEGDNFAGQASATVDFSVTGTAQGSQTYTVTVSSVEEDADPTDNSSSGTVTVNAAAVDVSSGGGGGGALGLLFLSLLGLVAAGARCPKLVRSVRY